MVPSPGTQSELWRDFVPGELLVKFRDDATFSAKAASLASISAVSAPAYRSIPGLHRVSLPAHSGVAVAMAQLGTHTAVEYAEPNWIVHVLALPNDERFGDQWPLHNVGGCCAVADSDIDAAEAWDLTTGSSDVVVAVIDTGVDFTHPDIVDNIYRNPLECDGNGVDDDANGYVDDCHGIDMVDDDSVPLDPHDHGTHVAGTIGARGNNGIGIAGVAWDVRIIACRFLDEEGSGNRADAIACLDYVAGMRDRGVNVVATNNSWGGGPPSRALRDAIRAQRDRGVLLVASAGNQMDVNDRFPQFPCNVDVSNVICVGASTWWDHGSWFSNVGRHTVHLFAPGELILSTVRNADYATFDGTSMAAPHVTGVIALLAAHDPTSDWRARKNLILSTVDRPPTIIGPTISGGRLNAFNALTCTNATLLAPLRPLVTERIVRAIDTPLSLRAMHIRCGEPAGPVQVSISGESPVVLLDDGAGEDEIAGDGVYTGQWTPRNAGEFEIAFIGATAAPFTVTVDPMLRRGFPATMLSTAQYRGYWWGGGANHVLVGEIDGDPGQEIVVSGFSLGPLYAWNDDGTAVPGWPPLDAFNVSYPALGEFDGDDSSLEVASLSIFTGVRVYDANAIVLPGWPQSIQDVSLPPASADLDGDGLDEVLAYPVRRSDGTLFGDFELPIYDRTGRWPSSMAVADLEGDGVLELILNSVAGVFASNSAGIVPGFPVHDPTLYLQGNQHTPVVGDVDADGAPEIIVFSDYLDIHVRSVARIYAWNGELERTIHFPLHANPGQPVLADLDDDGIPEIVFQTERELHAWRADGTDLPGWPVNLNGDPVVNTIWRAAADPVIGDLNGDRCPEVVTMTGDFLVEELYPFNGKLWVIDCTGNELPGFPKALPTMAFGFTPAIADLDGDGRNELAVAPVPIEGVERDALFVYELDRVGTHGPIEWGQYMAGSRHSGYYPLGKNLPAHAYLAVQVHGSGSVSTSGGAINCGADCIELLAKGSTVTLNAVAAAGSTFSGWRGACSGMSASCTVTVNELTRVSAWFLGPLRVEPTGTGAGTVLSMPAGIACPGDCEEQFPTGIVVTLTASPVVGSDFHSWSGQCSGAVRTCTVNGGYASTVTAHFVNRRTLRITQTGSGRVRLTSQPAGIDCGANCAAEFPPFSTVRLSYPSNGDASVRNWGAPGCSAIDFVCFVQMSSEITLTPTVELKPVVTVTKAGQGSGIVRSNPPALECGSNCSAPFMPNAFVQLEVEPDPGSEVAEFSGDCQAVDTRHCVWMLQRDSSVVVTFRALPMLTINRTGNGAGQITSVPTGIDCGATCQAVFTAGATVTVTATPTATSRFDGWTGACTGIELTCVVTINGPVTVGASFVAISTSGGGGGGGGGSSGGGGGGSTAPLPLLSLVLLLLSGQFVRRRQPTRP